MYYHKALMLSGVLSFLSAVHLSTRFRTFKQPKIKTDESEQSQVLFYLISLATNKLGIFNT